MGEDNLSAARAAFVDAWRQSRARLEKLCFRWMARDREAASDALGRVALLAVEELARESGVISNYAGWLTRLARNACVDIHRERVSKRRAMERLAMEEVWASEDLESPETRRMRLELERVLHQAIDDLPPSLSEPVRMRLVEEESYEHIAGALSLSPEAVRKRIQDARSRLREELSEHVDGPASRVRERRVESGVSTVRPRAAGM